VDEGRGRREAIGTAGLKLRIYAEGLEALPRSRGLVYPYPSPSPSPCPNLDAGPHQVNEIDLLGIRVAVMSDFKGTSVNGDPTVIVVVLGEANEADGSYRCDSDNRRANGFRSFGGVAGAGTTASGGWGLCSCVCN